MQKITFDDLIIELTRKCNMQPICNHCLRGMPQDITITKKDIDGLLNQTEIINQLSFIGGEPLIAIDKMEYILEQLYYRGILVFQFNIVTNGLMYNDKIMNTLKEYSEFVKLCRNIGMNDYDSIEEKVIMEISIDEFHNHQKLVLDNAKKYQKALKGFATVFIRTSGNAPIKTGNAINLPNAKDISYLIKHYDKQRIEILDNCHIPLCPQYKTYKLIHKNQVIVCCDLYMTAKGHLIHNLFAMFCSNDIVDEKTRLICKPSKENIYNSILEYNKDKLDCLSVKCNIWKELTNPVNVLLSVLNDFDNRIDEMELNKTYLQKTNIYGQARNINNDAIKKYKSLENSPVAFDVKTKNNILVNIQNHNFKCY